MTQNSFHISENSDAIFEEDEFDDDLHGQLHHPQQRNAANARERARMRILSKAFCRLKTTLPWVPPDTKLSKLDTLRLATSYIAHLRTILKLTENESANHNIHPVNMSWPFNFHLNWETSTLKNNELIFTKADRNDYRTIHSDKKRIQETNYDSVHNLQNSRKCETGRNSENKRKNTLNNYGIGKLTSQFNTENDYNYYKSCAYFNQ